MNKSDSPYYHHIDGLRALAVLAVFFYHLDIPFVSGGFVGVDIFFVISGYLITGIILKELRETGRFSFMNFYFRRVKRIMPALFFTLLASFAFSVWLLIPAKFTLFGGTLAAAAASVANIFLYRKAGYFDIFSQQNPLLHTWSLGVEEQFYLVWPVLLLCCLKLSGSKYRMLAAVALMGAISLGFNFIHHTSRPSAIFYLTQYRVFEFCIGATMLWLPVGIKEKSKVLAECLCLLGLALILLACFSYTEDTIFPGVNALVPAFGAALLIFAGDARYCGKLLRNKAAVFVGLISYSLYLVHWPLIVFVKAWNENTNAIENLLLPQKIAIFLLALLLAFLMYRFIEKPFRNIRRPAKKQQAIFIGKQCAALLCLVLLGVGVLRSNGWLWRVHTAIPADEVANFHQNNWGGAGFDGGVIYTGKHPEPAIVMMGDSHSGMLDTGIVDQIARPLDLTVFTASGGGAGKYFSSLLLPGTTRIDRKQQSAADDSVRTASVEAVKELSKSPDSVFLYAANYVYQIAGSGELDTHAPWNIQPEHADKPEDYQPFIAALERMRALLEGRKFLIVGNFPGVSKYQAMNCITQLRWFSNPPCSPQDPSIKNKAAIHINQILRHYAQKHDDVYFIDPYDFLCDEKHCKNIDETGAPLYSDDNHLSKAGSIYFFQRAREEILRILHHR